MPRTGAPAFGAMSARVASLILIALGICACQTQSASRLPGGSREACAERARQEAPDNRMGVDRQRDRWFIYRACMKESGLKP
jgi:hypothetical protein